MPNPRLLAGLIGLGTLGAVATPEDADALYIGPKGLRNLKGPAADKMLGAAERMAAQGARNGEILQSSGLFKSMDGIWRHEVSDMASVFSGVDTTPRLLGDVFHHPELYQAYPDLRNVKVRMFDFPDGLAGTYQRVNGDELIRLSPSADRSTLIHEIQHAIQHREGFARGGSPQDFNPVMAVRARDILQWRQRMERYISKNWPDKLPRLHTLQKADEALRQEYHMMGTPHLIPPDDVRLESMNRCYADGEFHRRILEDTVRDYGLDRSNVPHSPTHMYKRLAGEVEARDASKRASLSSQQRSQIPPGLLKDALIRHYGVPLAAGVTLASLMSPEDAEAATSPGFLSSLGNAFLQTGQEVIDAYRGPSAKVAEAIVPGSTMPRSVMEPEPSYGQRAMDLATGIPETAMDALALLGGPVSAVGDVLFKASTGPAMEGLYWLNGKAQASPETVRETLAQEGHGPPAQQHDALRKAVDAFLYRTVNPFRDLIPRSAQASGDQLPPSPAF